MTDSPSDARSVALSTRLYRALLRAYPAAFRVEYAEPMAQLFRDSCQHANRQGGMAAVLILWARILTDYARTILEEHMNGGIQMTRNTFVKLCGWALPVGAVSLTLGGLASNRPDYNPDNIRSLPIDRYANASGTFLIIFGLLLCVLGMVGILVRYGEAAGKWARTALIAGALSGLVAAAGAVILTLNPDGTAGWPMFMLGLTFMFAGLLVFGVACIQRKLLPRWNALPFLAAVWVPAFVLGNLIYQAVTGNWLEMPDLVGQLLMLGSLGGLALLGLVMLTDDWAPASQTPAT